jgi:DNA-binding NtrC family response regulator
MSQDSLRPGSENPSTEPLSDSGEQTILGGPAPRISLLVVHRDGAELALLRPDRPVTVGRAPPADLSIPDRTLSREHARFLLSDGRVTVEDLNSLNGTWIAGERVTTRVLDVGVEVMLGGVLVRLQVLGAPGEDPPAAVPPLPTKPQGSEVIVVGAAMRGLLETVGRVAASRIPVILRGETGTGKEVLARLIHDGGPRRPRRMVRVNCGAISPSLIESTLFGHEKGSFTTALQQQKGVFEEADKGTVFLDEIGELAPAAQVALLRVLETGCFSRVGSTREIAVDARLIAATHRDLEAMVEEGTFREDLFYRLNTIMLVIPPLRERVDEIGPLAARFLSQANKTSGRQVEGITPAALELLQAYRWPGNVRELRNAVERAVVVARADRIQPSDLPPRVHALDADATAPPPAVGAGKEHRKLVHNYEAQIIVDALNATGWIRRDAALRLGMPVRTLSHKMAVLGIKSPRT